MAKFDPDLSKVYLRQLRYRAYYPPRSTPWMKEGAR
jgi:type IV secretion system protein VirB3